MNTDTEVIAARKFESPRAPFQEITS